MQPRPLRNFWAPTPAPQASAELGEHREKVLSELGLSLKNAGVGIKAQWLIKLPQVKTRQ
ncbi:MAG: hypothetical protein CM15mP120_20020 [Pseudomonadota bacterium]|nr:MAG: hypothetical protein CM15mP120_20020 [Pseudomonadota bacterium]